MNKYELNSNFTPKGSHWQGNISDIAWIAIIDDEFKSTAKGYYPVFLFKGDLSGFYLTLALATKPLQKSKIKEHSKRFYILTKKYLLEKENDLNLSYFNYRFNGDQMIDLRDGEYYKNGEEYEDATIFAKYYDKNNLPSENELKEDLLEYVKLYEFTKEHNIFEIIEKSFDENNDYDEFLKNNNIDEKKLQPLLISEKKIGKNVLLYGVPGSGKSWTIKKDYCNDESRMERVIFHPDYTYGDFVGQILPKVSNGDVSYEFTSGPFTRIMKKAYENVYENYYLIIEEINRGNAPAIFGDIFQLLDRKNEENDDDFPIKTSEYFITNADMADKIYDDKQKEKFGDRVRIPSNLSIIATMNTSDQNVFTLDNAFQRRWTMRMIVNEFNDPDEKEFYSTPVLGTDVSWEKFCTTINEVILEKNQLLMSSEDKRLGVYFVNKEEVKNTELFAQKVIKYLWDDAFKFSREEVFDNKYTSLEYIIKDLKDNEVEKFSIFEKTIREKLEEKENQSPEN